MDETIIYLAILEDRHIDTQIECFTSAIRALKHITVWQVEYKDRYKWKEEDIGGWEYYVRSEIDDGPKMRLEKKVLR